MKVSTTTVVIVISLVVLIGGIVGADFLTSYFNHKTSTTQFSVALNVNQGVFLSNVTVFCPGCTPINNNTWTGTIYINGDNLSNMRNNNSVTTALGFFLAEGYISNSTCSGYVSRSMCIIPDYTAPFNLGLQFTQVSKTGTLYAIVYLANGVAFRFNSTGYQVHGSVTFVGKVN